MKVSENDIKRTVYKEWQQINKLNTFVVCEGQTSLTDYSRKEIKAMTHKEVSNLI